MKQAFIVISTYLFVIAASLLNVSFIEKTNYEFPFQDPTLPLEKRVDNLVSLLTLDEKISQMVNNAPAIKRLGIPAYNWWNETLHGVARSPYHVTSYPQAIAMAATWDTLSLRKMADYCAVEGRAIYNDSRRKGKTGIYLGLTYWTPNVNIFRDPRWGRGQETYGEDPFLTGTLGKAFVRGLEGNDPHYLKASACAKHFAVHSGPEWNRSTFNAKVSDFDLWDTYLPAFRDLIVDAKVSGVMCAYNALDGQPCCGNDKLMNNILRNEWKFTGYVTSDCGGIGHFWRTHKTHATQEKAASDAVLHGTDCECSAKPTYFALQKAVKEGLITEQQIDISVKRLFTIRFRLGMFDPLERVPFSKIKTSVLENPVHKAHALQMAQQSIVLLKNDNVLPLDASGFITTGRDSKKGKTIAVVGPNADDKSVMLSNYYGYPTAIASVLDGIRKKVGDNVLYEKGVNLIDNNVFKPNYATNAFTYNGENGFQAAYFKNTKLEGEPAVAQTVKKIDFQWGDGEQVAENIIANEMSIRFTANYTPSVSGEITFELKGDDKCKLLIDGEKRIETDLKNGYYTLVAEQGKTYKIVVEYVQFSDNAEIKLDVGIMEKASPQTIADRVKNADVIVFVGGISAKLEGEAMPVTIDGFKGGDRTNIALPTIQTELMKALKATGKPVVFINMSGGAMGFEWEAANLPAIIQAWYGGQAGGEAIADVLFGDYNPAGRLPITFYKNVKDLPDFEDYSMDNRTYRYFKGEPLYPFGFGLSYTHFQYKKLKLKVGKSHDVMVEGTVSNKGKIAGDEVVQLYISHKNTDFKTPIRSLKGFKRLYLKAGETQNVVFKLSKNELSEINAVGKSVAMQGELVVSVGGFQPSEKMILEGKVVQKMVQLGQKK
jgi:beta-glucosidase